MTEREIERTPDDDVLEPFEEDQAERRAAAARERARLAEEERLRAERIAPRIERARRVGGAPALVLVRSDPIEGRSTTVWFTDEEWTLIRLRVLGEHGLIPLEEQ